jgi:hypothetical protein
MAATAGDRHASPQRRWYRPARPKILLSTRTAAILAMATVAGIVVGAQAGIEAGITTGLTAAGTLDALIGRDRRDRER